MKQYILEHWAEIAVVVLLLGLFTPSVFSKEAEAELSLPTWVLCKDPEYFRQVIKAPSPQAAIAIATVQLTTGLCVQFDNLVKVRVHTVPVLTFLGEPGDLIVVWKVKSTKGNDVYTFSVTRVTSASLR